MSNSHKFTNRRREGNSSKSKKMSKEEMKKTRDELLRRISVAKTADEHSVLIKNLNEFDRLDKMSPELKIPFARTIWGKREGCNDRRVVDEVWFWVEKAAWNNRDRSSFSVNAFFRPPF